MKRIFLLSVLIFSGTFIAAAQKANDEALMKLERAAWDAFAKGDGKFFESFLSDDFQLLENQGFASKAETVKNISAKPCTMKSYDLTNFKVTMLNPNTALATYHVALDGMCGTQAVPAKVYASTIYVKRGNKWLGAFHQETPAR